MQQFLSQLFLIAVVVTHACGVLVLGWFEALLCFTLHFFIKDSTRDSQKSTEPSRAVRSPQRPESCPQDTARSTPPYQ